MKAAFPYAGVFYRVTLRRKYMLSADLSFISIDAEFSTKSRGREKGTDKQ
jgi:hypothetical protein